MNHNQFNILNSKNLITFKTGGCQLSSLYEKINIKKSELKLFYKEEIKDDEDIIYNDKIVIVINLVQGDENFKEILELLRKCGLYDKADFVLICLSKNKIHKISKSVYNYLKLNDYESKLKIMTHQLILDIDCTVLQINLPFIDKLKDFYIEYTIKNYKKYLTYFDLNKDVIKLGIFLNKEHEMISNTYWYRYRHDKKTEQQEEEELCESLFEYSEDFKNNLSDENDLLHYEIYINRKEKEEEHIDDENKSDIYKETIES